MRGIITTHVKSTAFLVLALLLGAGTALAFGFPGFGKAAEVKAVNGAVTIPVAQVDDGKAHFFTFADGGKQIGFFVVKGSDGALHVAFDACDVCFQEKKGYEQDGANMICKNCNRKFATNKIGKANSGGCNPSHLDFTQSAGSIVVKASDLRAGARYF
jgi:uncharacterized membrane protein